MNVKRYLRLLAIGLLLSLSPSMESYAVCLPDSLGINSGGGMFGDDDQSNPGLGDNDPGGGFTDGDQSNPTMGGSSNDGFSDEDMAEGGSSTPSPEETQFTLTDGEAYTLNKDTEVEQLMYRRTFSNTTWQALYVPFSIPVAVLEENGLQVAELNDSHMYDRDDDGVFEEVTIEFLRLTSGSTEANMPYMIRALEAGEKQITLTDVELKAAAEESIDCSTTKKLFTFTGTYSGVDGETMFANHYYAISGGALKPAANSSVGLKPQRWYMGIENRDGSPVEYNAPSIRLMVNGEWAEEMEEETTGLHTIGQSQPEEKIYTLEGVRVLNASRPGMYVQNGKIVVRK